MRFLIFNIASAAALAYLLWGQPGRIDTDGIATAIRDTGAAAVREIGQAAPRPAEPKTDPAPAPRPLPEPAKPSPASAAEKPPIPPAIPPAPMAPLKEATEVAAASAPVLEPLPTRDIPVRPVPKAAPLEVTVTPGAPRSVIRPPVLPPVDDPAVAKRRDEVLGRTPDAGAVATGRQLIRKAEGVEFMSPRDRRRELQRLAEEMELLYADKVHR